FGHRIRLPIRSGETFSTVPQRGQVALTAITRSFPPQRGFHRALFTSPPARTAARHRRKARPPSAAGSAPPPIPPPPPAFPSPAPGRAAVASAHAPVFSPFSSTVCVCFAAVLTSRTRSVSAPLSR